MAEDVLYEKQDHIALVTLNRPEVLNAYRGQTFRELAEIWDNINADDNVYAVVFTGAGRAFCAGGDMKALAADPNDLGVHPRRFDGYAEEDKLEVFKPIIAAVNGYAYGGGLSMAMACDIRIAAENASFAQPQVKRGIIGPHSTRRLVEVVPRGIAMEMMLTGDPITAQEAYRVGLVNKVVPLEELMPAAMAMAARISANAPLAVWASKESALGFTTRHDYSGANDAKEGFQAFAEHRPATYAGG
jgi:enoyl-CoA hydratase/carnithine racemase